MTIEQDFLPFATGGGANVVSQATYAGLSALSTGYQAGVAASNQLNKTWRQSSIMSAVLAQFIVNQTGQPAIDDGTTATLLANLGTAVGVAARQNPVLADTGTANAYAVSNLSAFTAYPTVSGLTIDVSIANTNTGASTLNVDGLGAKPILGLGLQPLQGGELILKGVACLMYIVASTVNSGNGAWVLMECAGGAQQVAPATASAHAAQFKQVVGIAGSAGNLKCVTTAVGTSLPYSADQLLVATGLNGLTYMIPSFSANISALDTGTLQANSFYCVYGYLKSDGTTGGFLQLEPSGGAPAVYGGANPPANMIASALIGVWPTNSSAQLIVASQYGRRLNFASTGVLNGSGSVATPTSISLAGAVPKCAKFAVGLLSITVNAGAVAVITLYDQTQTGASSITASNNSSGAGGASNNFPAFPILTQQTLYYITNTSAGTITNYNVALTGYEF